MLKSLAMLKRFLTGLLNILIGGLPSKCLKIAHAKCYLASGFFYCGTLWMMGVLAANVLSQGVAIE